MEIKKLDYWVGSAAHKCPKAGKMPALLY